MHPVRIDRAAKRALARQLEAAGVFERRPSRTWTLLALVLTGFLATLTAQILVGGWAWVVLAPVGAFFCTTLAMLGHEGGHRSLSPRRWECELLQLISFSAMNGLSATYWNHKHNALHHGQPNTVGVDPDVDLWPMAAHPGAYAAAGPARRWFQRTLQGWAFWPLTTQIPWAMRIAGVQVLLRRLRRGPRTRLVWLDAAGLVLHPVLWLGIPSLFFGFGPALAYYLGFYMLVGLHLGAIFAPAHMGLPLLEQEAAQQMDGWARQLRTTRNIRIPRWLAWSFVGLDKQIEHHLFPTIPHHHAARAAEIVERWCKAHHLPYREIGWLEGIDDVRRFMSRAWQTPPVEVTARRAA